MRREVTAGDGIRYWSVRCCDQVYRVHLVVLDGLDMEKNDLCALVVECALYPSIQVSIFISILLILLCDTLARCHWNCGGNQ